MPHSLPGDAGGRRLTGRQRGERRLRRIQPCTFQIHCRRPERWPRRRTFWQSCCWTLNNWH